MGGTRIEVGIAKAGRLSALASMFGRAFVDEPMMRWPEGGHGDVANRFRARCFAYCLEEVLERGFVGEAATPREQRSGSRQPFELCQGDVGGLGVGLDREWSAPASRCSAHACGDSFLAAPGHDRVSC